MDLIQKKILKPMIDTTSNKIIESKEETQRDL